MRVNQAYLDALSALHIIDSQLSIDKHAKPFIDPHKYKLPTKVKFLVYINLIFKGPYHLMHALGQKLCNPPWKSIENGKTGNRYYSWLHDPIDLETVNKIRSKAGPKKISVTQVR